MDLVPISTHTIIFSDNNPQIVSVLITNDLKLETDENFIARLSVSDPYVLLNPDEAQITIENDESKFRG